MGSLEPKVATYTEFAEVVLAAHQAHGLQRRAAHGRGGARALRLLRVPRDLLLRAREPLGTPEELKYLIDTAHGLASRCPRDMELDIYRLRLYDVIHDIL